MINEIISIIREHPSISNNWSITPNCPDAVDLTIGNTEYTIRSKKMWEKVEVTYKGAIRNVLGLTEGRWRSLDDFKVWLQEQVTHSGESNVPTFKQFYLSESTDKWPLLTILSGIAQGKSPIVLQVDNEVLERVRNELGITESVDVIEEANPAVIAAVSVAILGAAAIGLAVYAVKRAVENGYEVETHGSLPGGTNGTIILKKPQPVAIPQ